MKGFRLPFLPNDAESDSSEIRDWKREEKEKYAYWKEKLRWDEKKEKARLDEYWIRVK